MDVLAASLTVGGLADLPSGVRAEDDEVEAEAGKPAGFDGVSLARGQRC